MNANNLGDLRLAKVEVDHRYRPNHRRGNRQNSSLRIMVRAMRRQSLERACPPPVE